MTSKEIEGNFALLELGIKQAIALHRGNFSQTDLCLLRQIKDYVKELEETNTCLINALDIR